MAETVETKQQRLAKLQARKQALLEQAKAIDKRIARAESAEKTQRKKQDDRTKLLMGVAIFEAAQKHPHLRAMLRDAIRVLKPTDQTFLTQQSALWVEFLAEAQPAASPRPSANPKPAP